MIKFDYELQLVLGNDQPHNQVRQKDAMSSLAWHLAGDI